MRMKWSQVSERAQTVLIYAPIPLFLVIISPWTAWIIFLIVALIGLHEWRWIVFQKNQLFFTKRTRFALIAVALSMVLAIYSEWMGVILAIILAYFTNLKERKERRGILIWGQVILSLVGILACFVRAEENGLTLIGLALIITTFSDSAAYFVGKAIGRTKFAPATSPNKTWEGVIGGWVFAIIAAWIYCYFFVPQIAGWFWLWKLLLFWLLAFAGQLGDLAESALKRKYRVKDSGRLFPGHGGVLDRFDSFAPIIILLGFVLWVFA